MRRFREAVRLGAELVEAREHLVSLLDRKDSMREEPACAHEIEDVERQLDLGPLRRGAVHLLSHDQSIAGDGETSVTDIRASGAISMRVWR